MSYSRIPGNQHVTDVLDVGGTNGAITVGVTAVLAAVGAANRDARKMLSIHNNSANVIYWGFGSGVTTANGMPIGASCGVDIMASSNIDIYLISGSAGCNVRIAEGL